MPHENIVFDGYAFADEGVTLYLAIPADRGIFLYFNKGTYFGVVANGTPIKIDELREFDIFSQLYIVGNG
jgi:hypothetical protein